MIEVRLIFYYGKPAWLVIAQDKWLVEMVHELAKQAHDKHWRENSTSADPFPLDAAYQNGSGIPQVIGHWGCWWYQ